MKNQMNHNGYRGIVDYSDADNTFYGRIIGINDLITFEGASVKDLKKSFQDSVDDYLESCRQLAKEPQKEYRGMFNVRIPSNLHKMACNIAEIKKISLNKLVEEAILKAVQSDSQ